MIFIFSVWAATREELKKRAERMIDHAQKPVTKPTEPRQAESKRTGRVQCFRRAATGLFDCVCVCVCATSFIFFFFLSTGFLFFFCFLLRCRWYRITLFCIQLTKRKKTYGNFYFKSTHKRNRNFYFILFYFLKNKINFQKVS